MGWGFALSAGELLEDVPMLDDLAVLRRKKSAATVPRSSGANFNML
jgi:hypothetical protein